MNRVPNPPAQEEKCTYNFISCAANGCAELFGDVELCIDRDTPPFIPDPPITGGFSSANEDLIFQIGEVSDSITPTPTPIEDFVLPPNQVSPETYYLFNAQSAASALATAIQSVETFANLVLAPQIITSNTFGASTTRGLTYRDFINSAPDLPADTWKSKNEALVNDLTPVLENISGFLGSLESGGKRRRGLLLTPQVQGLIPGQSGTFVDYPWTTACALRENFATIVDGVPIYERWGNFSYSLPPLPDTTYPELSPDEISSLLGIEPFPGCNYTIKSDVIFQMIDRFGIRQAQLAWTEDSQLCCPRDSQAAQDAAILLVYTQAQLYLEPLSVGIVPTAETTDWLCTDDEGNAICELLAVRIKDIWDTMARTLCVI